MTGTMKSNSVKSNQKENLNGLKSNNNNNVPKENLTNGKIEMKHNSDPDDVEMRKNDETDSNGLCSRQSTRTPSPTAFIEQQSNQDSLESITANEENDAEIIIEPTENVEEQKDERDYKNLPIDNPFDLLIKAANVFNPKQFQLPLEYTPPYLFPGTSKKPYLNPFSGQLLINNNRSVNKKQPHELDNGMVPLPVKLCFQCGRSCRKAPLIQCDYCPLLFHPDCLNPPLTALPVSRWMCPNHVEPILEEKMLYSVSLSERVKLWDTYTGKLNSETVKLDFLKKVSRKNPPFRIKEQLPEKPRVRVPQSVKTMYRNPPQSFVQEMQIPQNQQEHFSCEAMMDKPSEEEKDMWLEMVLKMQNHFTERLIGERIKSSEPIVADVHNNETNFTNPTEKNENQTNILNNLTEFADLNKLDDKCIRILAMQRLQQLLRPKPSNQNEGERNQKQRICNETSSDITSKSFETNSKTTSFGRVETIPLLSEPILPNPNSASHYSHPRTYAVLSLLDGQTHSSENSSFVTSVPMLSRVMTLGRDSNCALDLRLFGNCCRFSKNHACIFYDQVCVLLAGTIFY